MSLSDLSHRPRAAGNTDQIVLWVQQAQAGDRQAFHQLADLFQAEIFRMIYYRTRSRMDAEDLTQDVFLRAFKHIGRLVSPALFRSWLYRIAVNRVRDHRRRQRIRSMFCMVSMDEEGFQETEEMAAPPEAAQNLARGKFWDQVRDIMSRLPRMEREVFYLRFFDQLSIKEITEALHKNESTIKTHLYRALGKVKAAAEAAGLGEESL
ncbi:MAG: RNA polymerase sigma factor [Desulfatitalea sp.]|nr:RNA polymerase sigma factor [Desulfatitalea sp.]